MAVKFSIFFINFLLYLTLAIRPCQADPNASWQRLGQDIELLKYSLNQTSGIFSNELTAIRTSLERFRVAAIVASDFNLEALDAKLACERSKAVVCINANFFDERGKALGLVISRGVKRQGIHLGGRTISGVFQVTRDGVAIVHHSSFAPVGVLEAIQAGPRLVDNGALVGTGDRASSNRSGVCLDRNKRLILYSIVSGLGGTTFPELQTLLKSLPFDCQDALNLDGGGSTQLYISAAVPGTPKTFSPIFVGGRDRVPVFLGLFPSEPAR